MAVGRLIALPTQDETGSVLAVTLARLDHELSWYDASAKRKKLAYRTLKCLELALAPLIPGAAALGLGSGGIVVLGVLSAVVIGMQYVYQPHRQWVAHRTTFEALAREKHLHAARARIYHEAADPDRLLAERVEAIRDAGTTAWAGAQATTLNERERAQPAPPEPGLG